ncbi:MAG: restriction endonuclease [Tannerellaceae bacterium]|jgi:hypothetical protein|nr:restriction endonuclease [Tannerellaceae bacterium]
MDDFWGVINERKFEEIAYEYAKYIQPDWDWKPTKLTRDGGRDGQATIVNIKTNFSRNIKKEVWYEAKYTKKYNHALPLSKIASTVLIGHNYREQVEKILIVTNAFFTAKTIKEIKTALNNNVLFITGLELKSWLLSEEQTYICKKYGFTQKGLTENVNFLFLDNPLIIKPNSVFNVVATYTDSLTIGEDYELFLTLNIPTHTKQEIDFEIIGVSDLVWISPSYELILNRGTNFIHIPFRPISKGVINSQNPILKLKEKNTNEIVDINIKARIESDKGIKVLNTSQHNCEYELDQAFITFKKLESGIYLYLVKGATGHGKSWMLENFLKKKHNQEYIYIKFRQNNNELNNSWLLIRLLTFIVFGKFFSDNKFDNKDESLDELNQDISLLNEISGYNKYYTEYLNYLADDNNTLENTNKLMGKRELIPFTNVTKNKIIVIDDLQFLEEKPSRLLLRILNELSTSNHKILIVCAKRDSHLKLAELDEFIDKYSARNPLKVELCENSVMDTLKSYQLNDIPTIVIRKLCRNLIVLKEFITIASFLEKKDPVNLLQNKSIKKILMGDIREIGYIHLSRGDKEIVDIIYFFEKGVEAQYLIKEYNNEAINDLLCKNMIRYEYADDIFVPYHDILTDSIIPKIKHNSKHIYKYALYRKDKGYIIEYLGVLGHFKTEFIKYRISFIKEIEIFHEKQQFFNIYYVLNRFFSAPGTETIIGNNYEKALLLFYYAYSTFNVGENNGREIFDKAYGTLSGKLSTEEQSLSNIILSEIANCDYWNLDFKSIEDKYRIITTDFFHKEKKTYFDWISFFTISTRYLSVLLFTDRAKLAEAIYDDITLKIPNEYINRIAIHVHLNFMSLNFINGPEKSYSMLADYIEKWPDLPVKNKFVLKSSFLKISCILGYSSTDEFEELIKWGQEQNLNYNYKIAKLELSLCYAIKKDLDRLEKTLNSVLDIRDFPILPLGTYYGLKALVYLNNRNYSDAMKCLNEQEICFSKLGESFQSKIKHNKMLVGLRPHEFSVSYNTELASQPTFYVETRF